MSWPERFFARYRLDLCVLLLFTVLTIIASWPLVAQIDTVIVGEDSDVYINLWADWWTAKAWRDPNISFWHTDYLFYPTGTSLAFHSFSHLNTVISLLLQTRLDHLPAYNLTILFNYVLAGVSMFHLARYLTGSAGAAVVAGIIFAFNSHNQYQSAHPVLISIWCIPWSGLFLIRAVRDNSRRHAALAAVFVFLGATSSTLLLILNGLWLAILLLYFFMSKEWPRPRMPVLATFIFLSGVSTLPLLYPLLGEYLLNRNSSFIMDSDQVLYIADIAAPLIPHWKLWLVRGFYLGLVPILLLVVARHRWPETGLWYGLTIGAYLISIGPYPTLLGRPLNVVLPWSLPIVPLLRNPYRVNILLSLGVAMLAAYGLTVILQSSVNHRRGRQIVTALIALLIFGEYTLPRFPLTQLQASPFYSEFLATVPDDVALALVPATRDAGKRYMYYQTLHGHPITWGTISRPGPDTFTFTEHNVLLGAGQPDWSTGPTPEEISTSLSNLSDAGIGYLILNKRLMGEEDRSQWQNAVPLTPVFEDEAVAVYRTNR